MEPNYYHSRLDKAKMLMAGRKEEVGDERKSESKKKKKHKDDRRSHSRSRDKKKRSHSKDERKHKKEHKHREEREERTHEHRDKDRERRDQPDRRNDHPERRNDDNKRNDDRRNDDRRNDDRRNDDRRDHYRDQGRQDAYRGGQDRRDNYRKDERTLEEKDPYYERRKQIERARIVNPKEAEQLEMELEKQILFDKKEKELEQAKEKFRQAQKEMEEAKREDHTILVYCLPLKAKERDIWNFFSKANCGKIRDIRIIKDARSGRSKGVAYVEFYTSDAVQKALTMTDRPFELKGRQFMGLRVQHSQAEKNRAAAAAKHMRVIKPVDPLEQQQEIIRRQTKVVVGGLIDNLAEMQESELKELFQPFGEIEYVDIHRDPQTGRCKGFAFIQYANTECAKAAVKDMNGLVIRKQKISVQTVNVAQRGDVSASDEFIYSAGTKQNLMNKLANGMSGPSHSNLQRPPISTVTTPYLIMTNMFKMQGTTPHYFEELKKEIIKEVEVFGTVERIFIEKNNQGNIWIKYSDTESAKKCQEGLNGKFFDNHKIFCYFVTENTYQNRVGI